MENYIQSAKTRPGVGPNHELLIAKFKLKWKNVRKTTRSFSESVSHSSYDLSQIPCDIQWR